MLNEADFLGWCRRLAFRLRQRNGEKNCFLMSAILLQSSRGWVSIRPSTKSLIAYQRGVAANGRPSPAQSVKHGKPSGSRGRNPNTRGPAL